jgi:hypothetical protein
MEKKSLGRGLEDIADIFISQKKEIDPTNDSLLVNPSKVVDGANSKYANQASEADTPVPENGNITTIGARYNADNNNANPEPSYQHVHPGRDDGLETGKHENAPKDCTNTCEISEHITINKKIGHLNTEDVQKNIVNSLFQHLGQNYELKKIELAKVSEVSRPGMKNIIEENVLIYIKGEGKSGN